MVGTRWFATKRNEILKMEITCPGSDFLQNNSHGQMTTDSQIKIDVIQQIYNNVKMWKFETRAKYFRYVQNMRICPPFPAKSHRTPLCGTRSQRPQCWKWRWTGKSRLRGFLGGSSWHCWVAVYKRGRQPFFSKFWRSVGNWLFSDCQSTRGSGEKSANCLTQRLQESSSALFQIHLCLVMTASVEGLLQFNSINAESLMTK